MPYLAFNLNDGNEFVFDILEERLSIGRDAKNDIVIDNTYISGSHAEFVRQVDGIYELVDLKSSNGTFVNGKRIERSTVKGGDKIRFGQLDARFRERAPKGTAPALGSKPSALHKGAAPSDGRRGDTETIPARDSEPKSETSPIEPTRISNLGEATSVTAPTAGSLPIAKPVNIAPDPALQRLADDLKNEVQRLQQERDLLRAENEKETRRREDVRALEKTLEEGQRELLNAEAKLAEARAALTRAQAETDKLSSKRRETANLDSQLESTRIQLGKVQADIETASAAFQSLHKDAEKVRGDRAEAAKHLEELRVQVQQHEVRQRELSSSIQNLESKSAQLQQIIQGYHKSETELKGSQSAELQAVTAQIEVRKSALAQIESNLSSAQQAAQVNEIDATSSVRVLREEKAVLEQQLTGLRSQLSEGQGQLSGLQQQRGLLDAAIAALLTKQQASERAISSFTASANSAKQSYEAAEERQRQIQSTLASLEGQQAVAAQKLASLEESIRAKSADLAQIEASLSAAKRREAEFENKTDLLASTETRLVHATRAVQDLQIQKDKLGTLVEQLSSRRSELDTTLSATQKQKQADLATLEAQIQARLAESERLGKVVADLRRQTELLESQAADLTNKLDDLAGTDVRLGDANSALKAVESHKAELTVAISQMVIERDSLTREILSATEKGVAQHALVQSLTARREAAESEVHSNEEHLAALSAEIGKVRESLRATEGSFESKKKELLAAESRANQLAQQSEESTRQQAQIQHEMAQLRGDLIKARAELQKVRADALEAVKASEEAATNNNQQRTQAATMQTQISDLETLLVTLLASQTDRQARISALESEQRHAEDILKDREQEISKAEARMTEVKGLTANLEVRVSELAAAEKNLTEAKAACAVAGKDLEAIRIETKRLSDERGDHEKRLPVLRADLTKAHTDLTAKLIELASSETRAKGLSLQVSQLEARETELLQAEKRLDEVRRELTHHTSERDNISPLVQGLLSQRVEHETLLPGLRADVQVLKTELQTLMDDKKSTLAALERVQRDRQAAVEQTESLRAESANLQKLIAEKRGTLDSELKVKVAEANQAEAKLREITAKMEASEKRLNDLALVQKQLAESQAALKETEARRQTEDKTLAELHKQQEKLRKELITLEDGVRAGTGQVNDLAKKIKAEEARSVDAAARLEKSTTALQAAETKRAEADAAVAKIREEEKALRKVIPALNTEMAGLQAALTKLTRERDEASQYVTRLNVSTDDGNKRIAMLQQQISQLEEAQRLREERVMKAQVEADQEAARVKIAQEKTRAVEATLQESEREVKDFKLKAEATRIQLAGLEADMKERLDRVEALKLEESRLIKELNARNSGIASAESALAELHDKSHQEAKRVSEFTHIGGQILSFGAELASLQTRQDEATKNLREAAERDLALQVKINALQEGGNRESARVEEIKQERIRVEKEFNVFNDIAQKQKASLQVIEAEQRKRLSEVEHRLHDQLSQAELLKQELAGLRDRRAEFAQAESQLKHWQGIEARLRGQLLELEEKHEIMRRGLPTDESTVVMFANDLIKRIDLIDALTSRYAGHNGGDVVTQLQTLRASFEDILFQHGVSEFDVALGTEVDTTLRKRIAVVDSIPGKDKPRVVETCRSGFIYSREEGHEVILRKVEVKTSSQ
jgi:chromosome segregation ATPase